jgi:glutathione synthase/RimK-type ligase-like ATP-grasp enzyme
MATENFVYPYRQGSKSAIALAQGIEGKVIRLENSKFKPSNRKTIINWGSTTIDPYTLRVAKVLNHPELVNRASNKKNFFELAKAAGENGPNVPEFTFSKEQARQWLTEEKPKKLFARTVLAGHSGEGIVKVNTVEDLEPLAEGTMLVVYVPKKREFRFHVDRKVGVFCIQEKLKKKEVPNEEVDYQIRNHANGFIFAKQDIDVPEGCKEQAVKALAVTGLDFGAVDVIYNERQEKAYALELNTAPGLEGSTVEDYIAMFDRMKND